jgi:hypothetical protein
MKGLKAVEKIQKDLLENVPWVTLEARGRSVGRYNVPSEYTWRITAADVTYWETEATNPKHRDATLYSSRDIPGRVLADFQRQLTKFKQDAEGFYKSAVEHLVPALVIKALDGENTSWKGALVDEISRLRKEIDQTLADARTYIQDSIYMVYVKKLAWQEITMGTLEFRKDHMSWDKSSLSMYMVLPQVLQEVNRWITMVHAVKAAYEK